MILKAKIKEVTEKIETEDTLISLNIDEDEISSIEDFSEFSLTTSFGLEKRFLINDNDLYILAKVILNKFDGIKKDNI